MKRRYEVKQYLVGIWEVGSRHLMHFESDDQAITEAKELRKFLIPWYVRPFIRWVVQRENSPASGYRTILR